MIAKPRRRAPAYQEYAADLLANTHYRLMTLEEKGLFHLLRNECWVNDRIPANIDELSTYLGIDMAKIASALTPRIMAFFNLKDGFLTSPELNDYRTYLAERSNKLSSAGAKGGKITQQKNRNNQATLEGSLKPMSREELNQVENNLADIKQTDPWIIEYDATPDLPTPYLIASRGN